MSTAGTRKPNIVFVLCDDLGINDLHCCGREDHNTPNLDAIARQGMRFTSAYATLPRPSVRLPGRGSSPA
ncbi:MAG: sulfatase-like hydrolase/transferase [Kiritimatiellia bacterium]